MLLSFLLPEFLMKRSIAASFISPDFQYFVKVMTELIEQRSKSDQEFHDFPENASQAFSTYTKKEDGKTVPMWNSEEINELVIAQSAIFLVAGFDTTAQTLSSCCYNLAVHPKIQETLHDVITSKIEEYGDVTHEMIQELPDLDNFINEVLRMYPPALKIERCCTKDITYGGIHIKKGMMITVSPFALHYSKENYEDPKTFNPDRWSPEHKIKINPYTFVPFGLGPRNCIGMRFAKEELKFVLCTLIKEFRFTQIEETPFPLKPLEGYNLLTKYPDIIVGLTSRN